MEQCVWKKSYAFVESESQLNANVEKQPASSTEAFVVSGFSGFNYELNQCPTLGSRLVAISGVPVDKSWSLAELQERIQMIDAERSLNSNTEKESGFESTTKRVLTLSFSDDHLSKSKKEHQSQIGKMLHGSADNIDAVTGTNLGATAEATVSSKLASSFNFLKKGPSAEATQKQDKQGGDHIKPESSSMTMPKMPTFFSTTSKGQDLSVPNGIEDDERINDKSSPTPKMPNIVMPNMTSIFGNKTKVQDSSTGSSEQKSDTPNKAAKDSEQDLIEMSEEQRRDSIDKEEKCDEPSFMGTGETQNSNALQNKTAAAEPQTASSSNLFHFFSSQSIVSTPMKASEREESKDNRFSMDLDTKAESPTKDDMMKTKDDVQLEPCPKTQTDNIHQVESKNDVDSAMHELDSTTDSTTNKDDKAVAKKTEEPSVSIKQEVSASDKFRSSMATMGKMFSKPFGHTTTFGQEMDPEDSML